MVTDPFIVFFFLKLLIKAYFCTEPNKTGSSNNSTPYHSKRHSSVVLVSQAIEFM